MRLPTNMRRSNANWTTDLIARYRAACAKEIAVGYPAGKAQAYPDGEKVAQVAACHEYGLGVPVRAFMTLGKLFINRDPKIAEIMQALSKQASDPSTNAGRVLSALQEAAGQQAADLIKQAIREGDWEPNSDSVRERKGEGSKPLIDTGHMINATTYVVRDRTRPQP